MYNFSLMKWFWLYPAARGAQHIGPPRPGLRHSQLSTKSEFRNPKQIQNSNVQNSKQKHHYIVISASFCFVHLNFGHSNLFRISCFEFRIFKGSARFFKTLTHPCPLCEGARHQTFSKPVFSLNLLINSSQRAG